MDNTKKKKLNQDVEAQVGAQLGGAASSTVQHGTDATHAGMDLFRAKGHRLAKVGYEQGKGNLFEFIEGAKLQKNLANKGAAPLDKFPVTDVPTSKGGFGEHTAPDDFRLTRNGRIIGTGQAKVNNDPHKAAVNFTNPKYTGMQRNTVVDAVPEIRAQLDQMLSNGEISRAAYDDACKHLTGCLTDPETGITSGGTTTAELERFRGADGKVSEKEVERYAKQFELQQYGVEITTTVANTAAASAAVTGIISGTKNFFAVFQDKKELGQALKDVGADIGKSGLRGGATGFLSSIIRIGGSKAKIPVISDSSAATVIAGGIIDGGVAIYEYAKGEISSEQLTEELQNTVIKSTATIYFTKAVGAAFGSSVFIPMAIYSAASYVVAATREIIQNAKLNAAEYMRIAQLNEEATQLAKEFHQTLKKQMDAYEQQQRTVLNGFLDTFDYNLETGENYDAAIYAIVNFATQTGLVLQHADFNDFSKAMESNADFVLK